MPSLKTQLGPLKLQNPLLTGSGTFTLDFAKFFDLSILGGIVPKSVSPRPRPGNASPRVTETPAGMLNAIGLENPGMEVFVEKALPKYEAIGVPLILNIVGDQCSDFVEVAEFLCHRDSCAAVEINLGCPNVERGGKVISSDTALIEEIISGVKAVTDKFLFAKLSPNVTDISESAKAAIGAGANGLTLINTLVGVAVDWKRRKPVLANITGGLSGPAIKPIALKMIHQVRQAFPEIPIMGSGGIACAEDVLEFLVVGANAVQIGSAAYNKPLLYQEILEELPKLLSEQGIESLEDWGAGKGF